MKKKKREKSPIFPFNVEPLKADIIRKVDKFPKFFRDFISNGLGFDKDF